MYELSAATGHMPYELVSVKRKSFKYRRLFRSGNVNEAACIVAVTVAMEVTTSTSLGKSVFQPIAVYSCRPHARLCWRRIPGALKTDHAILAALHNVCHTLSSHELPSVLC